MIKGCGGGKIPPPSTFRTLLSLTRPTHEVSGKWNYINSSYIPTDVQRLFALQGSGSPISYFHSFHCNNTHELRKPLRCFTQNLWIHSSWHSAQWNALVLWCSLIKCNLICWRELFNVVDLCGFNALKRLATFKLNPLNFSITTLKLVYTVFQL